MTRAATAIAILLLAAGCRAGFPSLSEAPEAPPSRLVAARDAAAAARADLAGLPPPAIQPVSPERSDRPARLLAALPVGASAPVGVIDRAVREARASGRAIQLVAVGTGAPAAAARLASLFLARGMTAQISEFRGLQDAPARVELYLLP